MTSDWEDIEGACRALYGDQEPRAWGTLIDWQLGGPDPLDRVRCYDAGTHWHYVGFGSSVSPTALTLRVAREDGDREPPMWPVTTLQHVARTAIERGGPPSPGDWVELGAPLGECEHDGAALTALLLAADPELGRDATSHGSMRFVQGVGVTADELDAVRDWHCDRFLALLRDYDPKLLTDLERPSRRDDARFEAAVQRGIDADGSSCGAAMTERVGWERTPRGVRVHVGAIAVPELVRMLRGRIPFGRPFTLSGSDATVVFWPHGVERREDELGDMALYVDLDAELARVVRESLQARAGRYSWPELPGLELVVEPSE